MVSTSDCTFCDIRSKPTQIIVFTSKGPVPCGYCPALPPSHAGYLTSSGGRIATTACRPWHDRKRWLVRKLKSVVHETLGYSRWGGSDTIPYTLFWIKVWDMNFFSWQSWYCWIIVGATQHPIQKDLFMYVLREWRQRRKCYLGKWFMRVSCSILSCIKGIDGYLEIVFNSSRTQQ